MKVALVVPGGVDRTGTRNVIPCLLWLIERLAAGGDEVHVFALDQEPRPGRWFLLGATVHNAGRSPRRLRALAQLAAEHRRGAFDVVHGFWAAGPGVIATAFGRLAGIPVVMSLPGGDLAALPDIDYGALLTRRGRMWTRLALGGAARVIVPSRWMAERAAEHGVEVVCIPFGVALDHWPASAPRRRTEPLRLVHVASLNRVKDQETLLLAAAALQRRGVTFRLDIVGQDTLDGAVQRRAADLGLGEVAHFHGFVDHAALRPWLEDAHILVMSSRHEAGPLVALEAAVAGVPTVGTAVGHIADWSPEAALAVPVGAAEALADAIARLASDEDERLRIARAAQARALAEDADYTARATRRLYEDVLGRIRRASSWSACSTRQGPASRIRRSS